MGNQVSSVRVAAAKLALESKKKGTRTEKAKIGILTFEVANVMSKAVQLWQSLTDREIFRLCEEIIKSDGVLNLVSSNETVLLSLACLEKLQDLTGVSLAVARLGRRCHEPALQGFEHVYNDILKQNIDVQELEFSHKEMETKIKKMERYISGTSNLYQELEILQEMEQTLRRARVEDNGGQKESIYVLEQKVAWQQQEIKYLKDISLWYRTYDKIVGLLARVVCTIYGRIVNVFGFPLTGFPQILSINNNSEASQSLQSGNLRRFDSHSQPLDCSIRPSGSQTINQKPSPIRQIDKAALPSCNGALSSPSRRSSYLGLNGLSSFPQHGIQESYRALSFCFSPGRQFSQEKNTCSRADNTMNVGNCQTDSLENLGGHSAHKDQKNMCALNGGLPSGHIAVNVSCSGPITQRMSCSGAYLNGGNAKLLFDPRNKLQNAPPSTLGGAALALHYANVIIMIEKMVRYPHLISQDTRDDLYQMLPKSVRMALRARLRLSMRDCSKCDGSFAAILANWKETLEKILSWLAPLAHNMIQWQSEHNFEQQQVVSRTNVLLLQTLYFADQSKAEAAITELLAGLNVLWRHERELKANALMEYASNKEVHLYSEWQY